MLKITPLILIALFINGCSYDCGKSDGLIINFVSYTPMEVKTYTIKKYLKGSNFNSFIDSLVLDSSKISYKLSNDSLLAFSSTGSVRLLSDFDYKITITLLARTYEITELYEEQQQAKKGFLSFTKEYCLNNIQAGKVNGLPASIKAASLFIKK